MRYRCIELVIDFVLTIILIGCGKNIYLVNNLTKILVDALINYNNQMFLLFGLSSYYLFIVTLFFEYLRRKKLRHMKTAL